MKSKLLISVFIVVILIITHEFSFGKEDGTWCRGFSSKKHWLAVGVMSLSSPEGPCYPQVYYEYCYCCSVTNEASFCNFANDHAACESLNVKRYNCGSIVQD